MSELGVVSSDEWWGNPTLDAGDEEEISDAMHEDGDVEVDDTEMSVHEQVVGADAERGEPEVVEPALDGGMQGVDDAIARSPRVF